MSLYDPYNRKIDYLRISITDRCNLRCIYCRPKTGVKNQPRQNILTYEELLAFAKAAVESGIRRIRVTGGEPLVRQDVAGFIEKLNLIDKIEEVSLTTNGTFLKENLHALRHAGLKRINISIDSLEPATYSRITRGGSLDTVLDGLEKALSLGFSPIKVNVVVLRNINDNLQPFARLIFNYPVHVRLIEFMPDFQHKYKNYLFSGEEIEAKIKALGAFKTNERLIGNGPAKYYELPGALGAFGIIGSAGGHLCPTCNRLRLTADGKLRTCLFSNDELDMHSILRADDHKAIIKSINQTLLKKPINRFAVDSNRANRAMSQIGG